MVRLTTILGLVCVLCISQWIPYAMCTNDNHPVMQSSFERHHPLLAAMMSAECRYPLFSTLNLTRLTEACLPLSIQEFGGLTDRHGRRVYQTSQMVSGMPLFNTIGSTVDDTNRPACVCRLNPSALSEIYEADDAIPQSCIDQTNAIIDRYALTDLDMTRVVLPPAHDAIEQSMEGKMAAPGNYKINALCYDRRTASTPFRPSVYGVHSDYEFYRVFLKQTTTESLATMYRNAGLHPTGHSPKGCLNGFIVGSGYGSYVRENYSTWDGKCFRPDGRVWNTVKPGEGPPVWTLPGKWKADGDSWFDSADATTLTYPNNEYWIKMTQLVSNGTVQTYTLFRDEVREVPDIPGLFLGQVHLLNVPGVIVSENLNENLPRDAVPVRGQPLFYFALFQSDEGLVDYCMKDCDEYGS